MHVNPIVAALSDRGLKRSHNEDSYAIVQRSREELLLVVADGLGGHSAGEIASQMAVHILCERFRTADEWPTEETLRLAIEAANRAILLESAENWNRRGMGTTLVAVQLKAEGALIAHVGDSRAYLWHAGTLRRLTQDHSWVEQQIQAGLLSVEEAAQHPFRHVITRSLGVEGAAQADVQHIVWAVGDQILLCSDGLCGVVADEALCEILSCHAPTQAVERLIEAALALGGPDNITVVLARLEETD